MPPPSPVLGQHHVLLINPNTSDSVTQRLALQLGAGWPQVHIHRATAPFGAPYIADEYSYCVAGHAVLQAWQAAQASAPPAGYGAVLVGCFGDPGLLALRQVAGVPVLGLAQAAVQWMAQQGWMQIGIATGGVQWQPMLQRWSRANGYADPTATPHIAHIQALPATGLEMMQSPEATAQALAHASADMLQSTAIQAVLLGGAGLAGMGQRVRALTGLPVWDCVEAAQQVLQQVLPSEASNRSASLDEI